MATKRKPKAAKAEPKTPQPASKGNGLTVEVGPGESVDRAIARELMAPSTQAAETIRKLENSDYELQGFVDELRGQIDAVHSGDLKRVEAMLITQAHTLNELFNNLTRRAVTNMGEYLNAAETYFRIALRAQSQCRATLETLVTVKNPPVIYAKQANVTTGPQQVNNGVAAPHTRENEIAQNKLLEQINGERLDTGTASTAGGFNPEMATVEQINRTENESR